MKILTFCPLLALLAVTLSATAAETTEDTTAASRGQYRAVILSGVAGDLKHSEKFQRIAGELFGLLETSFGYQRDDIVYLAADAGKTDTNVSEKSTKTNIALAVSELKKKTGEMDQTLVFVVGHADMYREEARIHLPGKDITPDEFADMFEDFPGSLLTAEQLATLNKKCGGRVLTDDDAPVENLLAPVFRVKEP